MILLLFLASLQSGPEMDLEAGFSGTVFRDAWTRVEVVVRNPGTPLEAGLRLAVRGPVIETALHRRELSIPAPSRKRHAFDLYLDGSEKEIEALLVDAKGSVIRKKTVTLLFAPDVERRILVAGAVPRSLRAAEKEIQAALAQAPLDRLPGGGVPLVGVDAIVVPDPGRLEPDQEEALLRWVEQGGKLVFAAGRGSSFRDEGLWRKLLPMGPGTTQEVSGVPMYSGDLRRGSPFLALGGRPAAVREARGHGEVVFLAFALDAEPFPAADLWRAVFQVPKPPEEPVVVKRPFRPVQKPQTYFEDTDSWMMALKPKGLGIDFGAFAVGGLAPLIYALLVSPLGFFWLRAKGQLARGFAFFALGTAAFTGFSLYWADHHTPHANQAVHWVFADEGRVHAVTVLKAGSGREFRVEAAGGALSAATRWAGSGDREELPSVVERGPALRLELPALFRRTIYSCREEAGFVTCAWEDRAARRIRVENRGPALTHGLLVTREVVYRVGEVKAGETRTVSLAALESTPFERWVFEDGKKGNARFMGDSHVRWGEIPPGRIGEILSVYELAGETARQGMDRYRLRQRGLDLSARLDRGEGLFLGRFEADRSGLKIDPGAQVEVRGLVRAVLR